MNSEGSDYIFWFKMNVLFKMDVCGPKYIYQKEGKEDLKSDICKSI